VEESDGSVNLEEIKVDMEGEVDKTPSKDMTEKKMKS